MALNHRKIIHHVYPTSGDIEGKTLTPEDNGRILVCGEKGKEGLYVVTNTTADRVSTDKTLSAATLSMGKDTAVDLGSGYTLSFSASDKIDKVFSAISENILKNKLSADTGNDKITESLNEVSGVASANKTNIAAISGDVKFTGAVTAITTGNSYLTTAKSGNSYTISAVTGAVSSVTGTGMLADAKDVKDYVDSSSTNAKISIDSTSTTSGSLRTYTFMQGSREIGKVEIDKEKFVQNGRVFTATGATEPAATGEKIDYTGLTSGETYIGLQIGATSDDINSALAIPAKSLVDTYKNEDGYLTINDYIISANVDKANGLASYNTLAAFSGSVITKFNDYATSANVVTELNKKANASDYKIKSGANGTNTTVAISEDGVLTVSANGVAVSATANTAETDLALRSDVKTLSGTVTGLTGTVGNALTAITTGNSYLAVGVASGHEQAISAVTGTVSSVTGTGMLADAYDVQLELKKKSDTGHTHDDRYYTESEINTKLAGKSDTGHTHTKSDITDFTETPIFSGATSTDNGTSGLVPSPTTADTESFLKGDGTWTKIDFKNEGITSLEFVENLDNSASSITTGPCRVKWIKTGTNVQIAIDEINGGEY